MRKHAKRHAHAAAVYQPSDFVSVVAIGITAIVLVLSLFAMERFAGVPVSVHGESASAPSDANLSRPTRVKSTKPSQTSKRAAARQARKPKAASGSSSSKAGILITPVAPASKTCDDAQSCSYLLELFIYGDPTCLKYKACGENAFHLSTFGVCSVESPQCGQIQSMYQFFAAHPECVTNYTAACKASTDDIVAHYRQ